MKNLCISKVPFDFAQVGIGHPDVKPFYKTVDKHQHLILGCTKVGLACLPTHFQGNPEAATHSAWPNGCQSGKPK
jgi:hypothetical protein